jgi:hypothetical protein
MHEIELLVNTLQTSSFRQETVYKEQVEKVI